MIEHTVHHKITTATSGVFNRLTQWKRILTARMLGVNTLSGPRYLNMPANVQAVADLFEEVLTLRAENNSLVQLLIAKGAFTSDQWTNRCAVESHKLADAIEKTFPGMRATDDGITMDAAVAQKTMANWGA
jgi:hypothetical protein